MRITEKGIYVIIEYSLIEKINMLLSTIITSSNYTKFRMYNRRFKNKKSHKSFIMHVSNLRNIFNANIKKTDDINVKENKKLILDLYELFNNVKDWRDDFVMDYNTYWDYESDKFPIPEIDTVLNNMYYIAAKLAEIVLDYEKMKKENMNFAEELAKYVFNPIRIINICEKYGLEDIELRKNLFDIDDYVLYLDLLDP